MTRNNLIRIFADEDYTDWFPGKESYTIKILYESIGLSFLTFLEDGVVRIDSEGFHLIEYKDIECVNFHKLVTNPGEVVITVKISTSNLYDMRLPEPDKVVIEEVTSFEEVQSEFSESEYYEPYIIRYNTTNGLRSLLYVKSSKRTYGILDFLGTFEQHSSLVEFWNGKVDNNELRY